jgi:hypothetical protein
MVSFLRSLNAKFKNNHRILKRIGYIILTVFVILAFVGISMLAYVRGYEKTINVNQDAIVYEFYPDKNYGASDYLRVGNYEFGKVQAYYHFNISSLPKGWKEIVIVVKFDYGSDFVDVGANLTYESWDEMTITWNNKPNQGIYRGHILCDGFDFRIPLRSEHIINDSVSVFLYGRGGGDDGYIQGHSKEGASSISDKAWIELSYTGIDPIILTGLSIAGIVILIMIIVVIGVVLLAIIVEPKFNKKRNHRNIMKRNQFGPEWLNGNLNEVNMPRSSATIEKKINQYITLKLEYGRTHIYVNGKQFIQCIRLILDIPKNDIAQYDEIESIDEAAKIYSNNLFQNRIVRGPGARPLLDQRHEVTAEQEFWGHCSNIQAWVEHDYDTRILMSNISFPLLRELARAGDPLAKKVFKEEIALRLESGHPSVIQYLINQGYISNFNNSEFKTILETTDIIKNLLSKPNELYRFLTSIIPRFPSFLGNILLEILKQPDGKKKLISSFSPSSNRIHARFYLRFNPRFFSAIKRAFEELLRRTEENLHDDIIDCLNSIEAKIEKQGFRTPVESGKARLELIRKGLLQNANVAPLDNQNDPLMEEKLKVMKALYGNLRWDQSKCRYCGKQIQKDQDTCEWCGHKRDDNEDDFFPYPFIFKPPGGGGGLNKQAIAISVKS